MHDLLFCSCFFLFVWYSPIKSVVLFVFFLYIFLVGDENMGAHIAVVCLLFFSLVVVLHGVLWSKTRKQIFLTQLI